MKLLSFGRLFGERWLSRVSGKRPRDMRGAAYRRKLAGRRPTLEFLEDRTLLSVIPAAIVTGNGVVNLDNRPLTTPPPDNHNSPSLAQDPINPQVLVTVWTRDDTANPENNPPGHPNPIIVDGAFSLDGGATWSAISISAKDAHPFASDIIDPLSSPTNPLPFPNDINPGVAFDRNHNFYVVADEDRPGDASGAILLYKFHLEGGVLTQTIDNKILYEWVNVDPAFSPTITVDNNPSTFQDPSTGVQQNDPFSGNVYVAWSTAYTAPTGAGNFNPNSIKVIASSDGGDTFSGEIFANSNMSTGKQHDSHPKLVVSAGTPDGRVPAGQLSIVFDDFGSGANATPVSYDLIRYTHTAGAVAAAFQGSPGHIHDATDPGGGAPHIPGETDLFARVDLPSTFTTISNVQVNLSILHANTSELLIQLISPNGTAITLVNNRTAPDGTTLNPPVWGIAGANMGQTPLGTYIGTTFNDNAPRSIFTGSGAAAPFPGTFSPEGAESALAVSNSTPGATLSAFDGMSATTANGQWELRIFDTRSEKVNGVDPVQNVLSWTVTFTSGFSPEGGGSIATSEVLGALNDNYPLKAAVSPDQGIGPTPVIAADNTLGSFSPNQGMLYVAYTGRLPLNEPEGPLGQSTGNQTDNTDIFLVTSGDGGQTWSSPVQVNDDQAAVDGFSEASNDPTVPPVGQISGRPQFGPSVAVDQTTGTLVLSWYDARHDASRARVGRYIAASIDGGQTFSPQTFLNLPEHAFDEASRRDVVIGPIPDNMSASNTNRDTAFGFGTQQSLLAYNGQVYAVWTGNENGGFDGRMESEILSATAQIATGPAIIDSTTGVVDAPINTTTAPDGTLLANSFDVQFDRPIDPSTFSTGAVAVLFESTTGQAAFLTVLSVTPLDLGSLGATQFQVTFNAQDAFNQTGTYVGTYSYTIFPQQQDRIRSENSLTTLQTQTFSASGLSLPIPPSGSGGSGDPAKDITYSTINVSGIPSGQVITHVSATLNLTDTFDSALIIRLRAPDGRIVTLSNEEGSGQNFTNTTFDDEASTPISQGSSPFTGSFQPDTPLSDLIDDSNPNGTWTLIIDDASSSTGTLSSWSIQISTGTFNSTSGNITRTAYSIPRSLVGIPFQGPFDPASVPLIVPGPHVVSTDVPGGSGSDNLVVNGTVSAIDVKFDRNMDPTTFTPSQVLRLIGPIGLIGPNGGLSATFSITPNPNGNDPDPAHPRTFRINFLTSDGTRPLAMNLNGTYTVTLASSIKSAAGDSLDTNLNAGLDVLRGTPSAGTTPITYTPSDTPVGIGDATQAGKVSDSNINVTDNYLVQGVTVRLNISYAHDPDLEATLIAPNGTRVTLFKNVGPNVTQGNFVNTVFDDAAFPVTPIDTGAPPFTGRFNPEQPLGDILLNGPISANGTWTLEIKDDVAGTIGTITNWSLTLVKPLSLTGLGEPIADQVTASFRIFTMDPTNPLSHSTWTSVGPGADGSGHGRIGGIAVDPSDPSGNTVYVAGASGGVWKTTDFLTPDPNGPTYIPLTDFGATFGINIGGLAVFGRNNDPNQSVVFAGTGEGDTGTPGVGFLRSSDGGATWTLLDSSTNVDASGNTLPLNSPSRDHIFVGTHTFRVLVDPRPTPSGNIIVYAALSGANGGVWRSTDNGNHWTLMRAGQATDIVFDPNSGHVNAISNPTGNLDIIYGAFAGDGVYISPNRGQVWNQLLGGVGDPLIQDGDHLPNSPIAVTSPPSTPNGAKGRIVLAKPALTGHFLVDGTYVGGDPAKDLLYEGWLYAVVVQPSGHLDGIYLTKDFGQNWTKVRIPTLAPRSTSTVLYVPSNDIRNPDYDPFGGGNFTQGNYDIAAAVNSVNPNILYVGGTADGQPTGLIRVDVTALSDPHAFFVGNDKIDGGLLINSTDPVILRGWPNQPGSFINPVEEPVINLVRNPFDPFNATATVKVSNTATFTNTGSGATWTAFDLGGTDQHRFLTLTDPLTGYSRLIIGDDQGMYTALDINGVPSTGLLTGENEQGGGSAARNGNLQIAQFYYGASQPSSAAAQIAQSLFYSGVQDGAATTSDQNVLSNGNIAWFDNFATAQGDGGGVATDQTGTGDIYAYKWPCCGGAGTDFFQVNGTGRTFGLLQQSNPGLTPDPQWHFGGVANFAVNPIDGSQAIISSFTGRIFSTADEGRTWLQIADPSVLDSTQSFAMAFGSPQPDDPTGALNDFLYVGTQAGHIFVTFDGGGANGNDWINLSAGLDGSAVRSIVTNPTRGSREAYAVTLNGVYHMVDAKASGATWVRINGNLFQVTHNVFTPFNDAAQLTDTQARYLEAIKADWRYAVPNDPTQVDNPNYTGPTHPALYVGGEGGVYRSLDNGTTWTIFPDVAHDGSPQDGGYLPNAHVTDLNLVLGNIDPTTGHPQMVDPNTGTPAPDVLLATTYGRGDFAIRVAPIIVPGSLQLDPNLPAPFGSNPGPVFGTISLLTPVIDGMSEQSLFGNHVKIELFDLSNGTPVPIGVDLNNPNQPYTFTDVNGRFEIQVEPGYLKADGSTDGLKTLGIRATDGAGVIGNMATFTFTLDTTPFIDPASVHLDANAPLPASQGGSDSGLSFTDHITYVTQPIIDGNVHQAAPVTVELFDSANPSVVIGSGMTDQNGHFSIQINPGVYKTDGSTDGVHTINILAVHLQSNSNQLTLTFTLDTQKPATPPAPTLLFSSDSSNGQFITNVTTPTFSGRGDGTDRGTIVLLFATNVSTNVMTQVGQSTLDNQGNYLVTVGPTPLADGSYKMQVQVEDPAGNFSNLSPVERPLLTIRTGAPNRPTVALDPASESIPGNSSETADIPATLDITAPGGTRVQVLDNGTVIDSFTMPLSQTAQRPENLTEGIHPIQVTSTDVAGNTSFSSTLVLIIDSAALNSDLTFIRSLYSLNLGRTGTLPEWNSWIPVLNQLNGRFVVANDIARAPEARDFLVKGWYQTYLKRTAMRGEEAPFVRLLVSGMTEEQTLSILLGSAEYFLKSAAVVGATTPSNTTFVQALYIQLLNRQPGAGEINLWTSLLNQGVSRQQVANALLTSREYREDVVAGFYVNLLRRPTLPARSEVDAWALSPLDLTSIRVGFEASAEYFFRVTGFQP
jgi:subtilisin-like proprotein convertase family protein